MKILSLGFAILLFIFSKPGLAQENQSADLKFEVNKIYPYLSISEKQLQEAQTLLDLHEKYPSSWIKDYISVSIQTVHQGKTRKASGDTAELNDAQKRNLVSADRAPGIEVEVHYIPNNHLSQNEPKVLHFKVGIIPKKSATYIGGIEKLNPYLVQNAIENIPPSRFKDFDLATILFTVNTSGAITEAQVFQSVYNTRQDQEIDQLLLEAIRNMPNWQPAEYLDGTKVKQAFAFTVGNHESCLINLLNLQRDRLAQKD